MNPLYLADPKATRRWMENVEEVLANAKAYDDMRKDALELCDLLRKALNEIDDRRAGLPT